MSPTNSCSLAVTLLAILFNLGAGAARVNAAEAGKTGNTVFYGKGRIASPEQQSYALIRKSAESMIISGNGEDVPVDALKKTIKGDFIWFRDEQRTFVIDDPVLLLRANAAWTRYDSASDKVRTAKRELRVREKTLSRMEPSQEASKEKRAISTLEAKIDLLEQDRTVAFDAAQAAMRGLISEAARTGKTAAFPFTPAD